MENFVFANSAATLSPEYSMDMVRLGIALYGFDPFDSSTKDLRPVMRLRSIISHIKTLKAGESVSYGRRFTADKEMRVATVPIGYADGLFRSTSWGGYTLKIGDKPARILGSICMDQLMLDVSDIDCQVGDTVTVFDGTAPHTANDLARINGTIPYEILCAVSKRVPRAFVKNNQIIDWNDVIYE